MKKLTKRVTTSLKSDKPSNIISKGVDSASNYEREIAKKPSDVIVVDPAITKVMLSISNFKVPRSAKIGGSVIYS